MAKKKVELKDNPVVLVGGAILVLVLMFVGASFLGERQAVDRAESRLTPVKKLRAKADTERKNAMALTSSQRSVAEEKGEGTHNPLVEGSTPSGPTINFPFK